MGCPTDPTRRRRRRPLAALAGLAVALAAAGCVAPPPPGEDALPAAVDVRAESVARLAEQATVRVRNRVCEGLATGSGVVIGDGMLVTNRHVVEGAGELQVSTWDGRTFDVGVASTATRADLAVARVEGDLPPAIVPADDDPRPGSAVSAVGYPLGSQLAFSDGEVVDYQAGAHYGEESEVLRVTAQLRPGNSGGPLVDEQGRLVGVVFAVESSTDLGLAIPVSALQALLADDGAFAEIDPADC
ncbi:MAG TPA: serine protease [Acidimicrobiales bacterium]